MGAKLALTLVSQQMLYNNVKTFSPGLKCKKKLYCVQIQSMNIWKLETPEQQRTI